ncbi:FAD-dependent oxidoreductase [Marinicrinis lubricantis]|uniref:Aerobic glycerol-3-phosphate dehydrogenase n=1 Tax=Marinicrinis lubricantis TaxID=2086470 RepID=A0ABW1IR50_9BACL
MKRKCSARYRCELLRDMSREGLDLLIIGGGLTAASIAWEAAGQGLRTGLIEEHDFASWSDGLTAGTVPDLEWDDWRHKAEVNSECDYYRRLAPHTVQQQRFVLPYYKKNSTAHLRTRLKLKGFEWMSRKKGPFGAKLLSSEQMLERYPLMLQRKLKGGLEYDEYVHDIGRLTIELMKGAYERGALACNYAGVSSWLEQNGSIVGAVVEDRLRKKAYTIQAKAIIIASGPLNGRYLKLQPLHKESYIPQEMDSRFHMVIENKHFQLEQALSIPTLEGGFLEVIPFKGMIHVTAKVPSADLHSDWNIDKQMGWMLSGLKEVFPGVDLSVNDVEYHWESHVPMDSSSRLHATSYDAIVVEEASLAELRRTTLDAVQAVVHYLKEAHDWRTGSMPLVDSKLPGGGFIGKDFSVYRDLTIQSFVQRGIPKRWAGHLLDAYGSSSEYIISYFSEISDKESVLMRLLCAEILYAVEYEMAASCADVLIRRTGLGSIHYSYVEEIMDSVIQICGELLEWDKGEQYRQREWLRLELSHRGVKLTDQEQQEGAVKAETDEAQGSGHNAEQAEQEYESDDHDRERSEATAVIGEMVTTGQDGQAEESTVKSAAEMFHSDEQPSVKMEHATWGDLKLAGQEASAGLEDLNQDKSADIAPGEHGTGAKNRGE